MKHTAPHVSDRLFPVRVTFRDGYSVVIENVDYDSVTVDFPEDKRACLVLETYPDNRIIRFPVVMVAYWEVECR